MLNKRFRLQKNSSFIATYKQRKVVSDEFFVLYGGKNKVDMAMPTRAGFVVSKKIHKRAVRRNRIKRRLRESFKVILKNNDEIRPMSLIYVAKEGALKADFQTVLTSVTNLLQRFIKKY